MNRLLKIFLVIGMNSLVAFLFYYTLIKFVLRIRINDAIGLILVGSIAYIVGCIYYLRYENKKKNRKEGLPENEG